MSPLKMPLPVEDLGPPSNAWFLKPTRISSLPNDISIGSAVFAQLSRVPNTQTHRPRYVRHLQQYAASMYRVQATRPNNINKISTYTKLSESTEASIDSHVELSLFLRRLIRYTDVAAAAAAAAATATFSVVRSVFNARHIAPIAERLSPPASSVPPPPVASTPTTRFI